jgi:hypothetical protein
MFGGGKVNELAILVIGMIFGGGILLMALAAGFLFWTAVQMRKDSGDAKKETTAAIKANTVAIDKMRGEVALALSQMDAQRLYEASVAIQKASKLLISSTAQLNKVVYAATPPDIPVEQGWNLDEEAAEDARISAERNRWMAGQEPDAIDPAAVQDFFANRNKRNGVYSVGSTPPATTAYEELAQQQPMKPVETLPDFDPDSELTGAGEINK